MRHLSPGWATDLAVLRHMGSTVEDHDDHLVARTSHNPDFHWGNCVFVRDEDTIDDAPRWVNTFHAAFPEASWVAVGLPRMPDDGTAWASLALDLALDDVLTTRTLPRQTPRPAGYGVRRLTGKDWNQSISRDLEENRRTGVYEPASHERFVQAQVRGQRAMSERGVAAFFGAFANDVLVAALGIVICGSVARYQSVGTDDEHRHRGLASHLLGIAARWSAECGCEQWVIVTEATNPAGRVYRRAGFQPDIGYAEAYRRPSR